MSAVTDTPTAHWTLKYRGCTQKPLAFFPWRGEQCMQMSCVMTVTRVKLSVSATRRALADSLHVAFALHVRSRGPRARRSRGRVSLHLLPLPILPHLLPLPNGFVRIEHVQSVMLSRSNEHMRQLCTRARKWSPEAERVADARARASRF